MNSATIIYIIVLYFSPDYVAGPMIDSTIATIGNSPKNKTKSSPQNSTKNKKAVPKEKNRDIHPPPHTHIQEKVQTHSDPGLFLFEMKSLQN